MNVPLGAHNSYTVIKRGQDGGHRHTASLQRLVPNFVKKKKKKGKKGGMGKCLPREQPLPQQQNKKVKLTCKKRLWDAVTLTLSATYRNPHDILHYLLGGFFFLQNKTKQVNISVQTTKKAPSSLPPLFQIHKKKKNTKKREVESANASPFIGGRSH